MKGEMKAITIKQPWATLIAVGEKKFETRSWPVRYRGQIAIHAGKTADMSACNSKPIRRVLAKHGYGSPADLPTGAVIAVGELAACYQIQSFSEEKQDVILVHDDEFVHLSAERDALEICFGDYSEGRYAWEIRGLNKLILPAPCKGKLGLWSWTY
ncbi:ASCH domain-containing protein [Paenibacillus antibioticophila]|uniref:ASCH domain-containing protein n=1 Tax=Paenibacillus antibioticophila TaxID=1274374 RepID=UPI000AE54149|nr:ASCH domain-containing protein [Paenibacillus antibioticophila]